MKFAKELDQGLVPEWRVKYINYKVGKKKIKIITRAINRANANTPRTGLFRTPTLDAIPGPSPFFRGLGFSSPGNSYQASIVRDSSTPLQATAEPFGVDSRPVSDGSLAESRPANNDVSASTPILIQGRNGGQGGGDDNTMQYGSIVATPPSTAKATSSTRFELPEPAVAADDGTDMVASPQPATTPSRPSFGGRAQSQIRSSIAETSNAYEVGITSPAPRKTFRFSDLRAEITRSSPASGTKRSNLVSSKKLLSIATPAALARENSNRSDVKMGEIQQQQVRLRDKEFKEWLDTELEKIETFYQMKEDEAGERLKILRDQLHEMRNRRIQEIAEAMEAKERLRERESTTLLSLGIKDKRHSDGHANDTDAQGRPSDIVNAWIVPIERAYENAKVKAMGPHPGSNSKALQNMGPTPYTPYLPYLPVDGKHFPTPGQDYQRRFPNHDVPYRTAKRKLKLALKEYYRGLELLKSYALLNRTGFRKINKKYDKAVNAHPPLQYMAEKVNKAHFVQSEILDSHIHAVEDLYARYFERGNHKVAIGKLRSSGGRPGEYNGTAFRSGIMLGVGGVFAIQGLISATDVQKYNPNPDLVMRTTYLLQIYAGYFLALYLFSLFCLDCVIWSANKINYPFIFEFDPLHHLDWRQLSEFPSFFMLLMGLVMWLNFTIVSLDNPLYIYWPVILIGVSVILVFLPGPTLFHRSRRWFVYSNWRLILAGFYPVEFRDFFLGDMYCSLTYYTANISLFFCLYRFGWYDPSQCNSTHSRLMGFFATLPAICRALQCIRRYRDTGDWFPHMANCAKYLATIAYYLTLSVYRIDQSYTNLAIFVFFATVNAVYVSVWDLFFDWSLFQPNAKKRFLRNVRGYKNPMYYYAAMIIDPILRFNWIFYAIYTHDVQHSTLTSFLVAFSEVTRRGMWCIFRVENEHCANVTKFKASRDVPLPYQLQDENATLLAHEVGATASGVEAPASPAMRRNSLVAEEGQTTASSSGPSGATRRRTLTSILANAHTQDFEKKRKPGVSSDSTRAGRRGATGSLSDIDDDSDRGGSSDEDEDAQDVLDAMQAAELRRSHLATGGGSSE